MPRTTRGSIFRTKTGVGIRWPESGRRPQKEGFKSEREARAWFEQHALPRLRPTLQDACGQIRTWTERRRHQADEGGTWVYVVAAPDAQRLKIGLSKNPEKRLGALKTGSPIPLRTLLIIPGGPLLESALLRATAPFAIPGASREWRTIDALEVVFALIRERSRGTLQLRRAA